MNQRLALTPAVGLFAGLSVVSYGAVSMLLTGVHETRLASTNPCTSSATSSPTATASTKALTRPAARTGARGQHPAGMPVLLADAVRLSSASRQHAHQAAAASVTGQAQGGASASQTHSTLPSSQPSPNSSTLPLPQPSPGMSATPAPGGSVPQPAPNKTSSSKGGLTPGGTLKSPIATPTATPTTTATPTSTPTTPPPLGTLCMTVQTLNSVSAVDPNTTIGYAIFVWLTSGSGGTAKITLAAKPSSVSPTFSVCAPSGKSKCTVSGLNAGQKVEVQAELAAPARPTKHVTLTVTASSAQASNSATASATVDIKPKNSPSPTSSPTPGTGDGATLPSVGLPGGTTTIPGLGIQPSGDLGSAFPQVSPSPGASGAAAPQHGHSTRTIDLSAGLPLDVRLIGGQVIGLAVLAAAVTIAVARLSLRRQPPRHGEDSTGS
jgi:hypothetical protein